jgi:hypothetical protein
VSQQAQAFILTIMKKLLFICALLLSLNGFSQRADLYSIGIWDSTKTYYPGDTITFWLQISGDAQYYTNVAIFNVQRPYGERALYRKSALLNQLQRVNINSIMPLRYVYLIKIAIPDTASLGNYTASLEHTLNTYDDLGRYVNFKLPLSFNTPAAVEHFFEAPEEPGLTKLYTVQGSLFADFWGYKTPDNIPSGVYIYTFENRKGIRSGKIHID